MADADATLFPNRDGAKLEEVEAMLNDAFEYAARQLLCIAVALEELDRRRHRRASRAPSDDQRPTASPRTTAAAPAPASLAPRHARPVVNPESRSA